VVVFFSEAGLGDYVRDMVQHNVAQTVEEVNIKYPTSKLSSEWSFQTSRAPHPVVIQYIRFVGVEIRRFASPSNGH